METHKAAPIDFIKNSYNHEVLIKLNDNSEYKGTLLCLDGAMNVALQHCVEMKDGKSISKLGETFFRGNNVIYIEYL